MSTVVDPSETMNLLQCLGLASRAIGINGLRLLHHRLRITRLAPRPLAGGAIGGAGFTPKPQNPEDTINTLFQWKRAAP